MRPKKGFTLIELLIVVAIIAILAAIAIPNFLEAQVRSKVSRAKSELRTVSVALEAYRVDHTGYPPDGTNILPGQEDYDYWHLNQTLTTPIVYVSNVDRIVDPFKLQRAERWNRTYRYKNIDWTWGTQGSRTTKSIYYGILITCYTGHWSLSSNGPDRTYGPSSPGWRTELGYPVWPMPYDPTNGTVSDGDIERTQLSSEGLKP